MKTKVKKIAINKNDEPASVVEKIIDTDASEIVLSIPRFSRLVESLANFHLIKRESELLKKKIIIESIDDKAIELANLAKLQAVNPFFIKSRKQFSDIVTGGADALKFRAKKQIAARTKMFTPEESKAPRRSGIKPPSLRKTIIFSAIAAAVLAALFIAINILPRAKVTVFAKKQAWEYQDAVIADKLLVANDAEQNKIPGQVFSEARDLQQEYHASGKKVVEQKARGAITIFNAYSSAPQVLVATTRFLTPDGKLYRLVRNVTVPGAEIVNGEIQPTSTDAEVVADKPGEEFNIGPVSHFSIPGFKGSPRFDAFYGRSTESITGGFIGEVAYPTEADLQNAKTAFRAALREALEGALTGQIPEEFMLIEGATEITFEEPEVIANESSGGTFQLRGQGTARAIALREEDVVDILNQKVKSEFGKNFTMKEFELVYGEGRTDFRRGIMSFALEARADVVQFIDGEALRDAIANKSENELRAIVFGLPGIESANISLWPFWVQKVPSNKDKIAVTID